MPPISSLHNPTIKRIRSLADKKHRQEQGLFVAEGAKVLARAQSLGWEPEIVVSTGRAEPWGGATMIEVTEPVMVSLSAQNNPPPVVAVFHQRFARQVSLDGLWLALEGLRDPGNLGSIIRTADAAGAMGIVLAGPTCDPWGRDCVRATMGSIFAVPLIRLSTVKLIDLCHAWPGDVAGSHLQGTEDFRRSYREPTLLVVGSEGEGLSPQLAAACSVLVRIPMRAGPDSLNVAAATALMLYEVRRTAL
ncbi:MAG: RNA methyltransferase [Rhizobiales bacterium]|nr:RNA methyltransferase [Hyphomicrobiales bacterium]